jgi:purine-nucleoside phosphorylase
MKKPTKKAFKPKTPTPHIGAKNGEIAPLVLLSGDPNRAKWIAETFLKNVKCVTTVRGLLGFTGTWNGVSVTIMTSGMGQPSLGIIVNELVQFYGVKK